MNIRYNITLSLLTIILTILFIFSNLTNKAIILFFLALILLLLSTRHFFIGCLINNILLICVPYILNQNNYIFLDDAQTHIIIFILCIVFITSITNFLILSYNISNNTIVSKFNIVNIFNKTYLKIFCIFLLYLGLLYSVITSFAILYTYLGNVFNEGIVDGTEEIFNHLDALYFSTTTFFTIGFGDIKPMEYSEITKRLVIIQAVISHLITSVLWPVSIIFVFGKISNKQ